MQLLTPEDVKKEKTDELGKKRALIASLADEESRVNLRLNQAKEKDIAERARIETEFALFENQMTQRRAELSREVAALESRRASALKPIENIQQEADALLEQNKKDEASIREQEIVLSRKKDELIERIEALKDREQELDEREADVITKEARAKDEAEQLRLSQRKLTEDWARYHTSVHLFNAEMTEKEAKIASEWAGIEAGRKINAEEAQRLTIERRALHDAYLELEQAKKHHG